MPKLSFSLVEDCIKKTNYNVFEAISIISASSDRIVLKLNTDTATYNISELSTFAKKLRSGELSNSTKKIDIQLESRKEASLYKTVSNDKLVYPVTSYSAPEKRKENEYQKRIYQSPTTINLEITEGCNFKCNHCYNPWREVSSGINSLSRKQFDYLVEQFKDNGIFHVVLSGGEPFSNFDTLCYALEKLHSNNITTSVNSNLSLATTNKMKRLIDIGLDHILTSWYSDNDDTTSQITNVNNAQKLVIDGIKTAVDAGVRVSVNTVVTQHNKHILYQSGKIVAELGAFQFLAYRAVPPVHERGNVSDEISLSRQEALESLDTLLRLNKEYGIQVGTLISYPLCLLGDLKKYSSFVGRGCPSQQGYRFTIHPDGSTHSCVMEDLDYGNVFKVGIRSAFQKNRNNWMDGSYFHNECKGCDYIDICHTGCRMDALSRTGYMDGQDPFMTNKDAIYEPLEYVNDPKILNTLKTMRFVPKKDLRFREENGFGLINIRWSNIIEADKDLFELIRGAFVDRRSIPFSDFLNIKKMSLEYLGTLVSKEVFEPLDKFSNFQRKGVSIDPCTIPGIFKKHISQQ